MLKKNLQKVTYIKNAYSFVRYVHNNKKIKKYPSSLHLQPFCLLLKDLKKDNIQDEL